METETDRDLKLALLIARFRRKLAERHAKALIQYLRGGKNERPTDDTEA